MVSPPFVCGVDLRQHFVDQVPGLLQLAFVLRREHPADLLFQPGAPRYSAIAFASAFWSTPAALRGRAGRASC
jgi:hypothetical protein